MCVIARMCFYVLLLNTLFCSSHSLDSMGKKGKINNKDKNMNKTIRGTKIEYISHDEYVEKKIKERKDNVYYKNLEKRQGKIDLNRILELQKNNKK